MTYWINVYRSGEVSGACLARSYAEFLSVFRRTAYRVKVTLK